MVALDLETTGLDVRQDKIIEIGMIRFDGAQVLETYQTFINPDRPIPPAVTQLTHITNPMVSKAPHILDVLDEVSDFAGNDAIVGHNIGFDLGFLHRYKILMNFSNLTFFRDKYSRDDEGNSIADPRSFEMFSRMISGIKDWDNEDSQMLIRNIAKGSFKDKDNKFGQMFTTFIRNKMHLLIQPKQMLLGAWDTVRPKLEEALYDQDGTYRPDIASLLERRFAYHVNAWLDSDGETPISKVKERVLDFIKYDKTGNSHPRLFTEDMFYHMITTITSDHKAQTNKLLYEPEITKKIN